MHNQQETLDQLEAQDLRVEPDQPDHWAAPDLLDQPDRRGQQGQQVLKDPREYKDLLAQAVQLAELDSRATREELAPQDPREIPDTPDSWVIPERLGRPVLQDIPAILDRREQLV